MEVPAVKAELLRKQFLGGYFALASYIIDLGITNADDLNMATEIGLVIAPPFSLMNKTGMSESYDLVNVWCEEHTRFPFPKSLEQAKNHGGWKISNIVRTTRDQVAVLTIRRPRVLNALNLQVLTQLNEEVKKAEADASVKAIVITGFGKKAFVSGADLNMLTGLKTPDEGYHNSHTFQGFLNNIEQCQKSVVCALNGFAFGGGLELAMSCTARIAKKGLPVLACHPEVNLGFIPGAGGTQRLPRLVGIDIAAEILRTARPVSGSEAYEIGLIDREAESDLVEEAVAFANQLASGKAKPGNIKKDIGEHYEPMNIDIGHLSKRIDEIMNRAIYEGINLPLEEALELESKLFGECILTDDMKIGLENFKKNGPRAKAEFKHS